MKKLVNLTIVILLVTAAAVAQNAADLFRLGAEQYNQGQFAAAAESYEKAAEAGYIPTPQAYYRAGRAYARLKQPDKAFAALDHAVRLGFAQGPTLQADAEFANIREDPRFAKLLATLEQRQHPCKYQPEYRQFDFWIGEWDVQTPNGQTFARSSIQLIIDQCVIFENYEHASLGYAGKSFSAYNAVSKQWTQRWIDNTGAINDYVAEFVNGEMRFHREGTSPTGVKTLNKMTFFNLGPDKVRQLLEVSTDGGKTWTAGYDGIYVRRK